MLQQFSKSFLIACALYGVATSASFAGDDKQLTITPKPGKTVCQSTSTIIGETSVKAELCVSQGNFSHDNYFLKIDGKTLIKGIDDETTNGISSAYNNQQINLKCVPQEVKPNATPEEIQKIMPNTPVEKTRSYAELMKNSSLSMEVGRLCTAIADNKQFIEVQVIFE